MTATPKLIECPDCLGEGRRDGADNPCPTCEGAGELAVVPHGAPVPGPHPDAARLDWLEGQPAGYLRHFPPWSDYVGWVCDGGRGGMTARAAIDAAIEAERGRT